MAKILVSSFPGLERASLENHKGFYSMFFSLGHYTIGHFQTPPTQIWRF